MEMSQVQIATLELGEKVGRVWSGGRLWRISRNLQHIIFSLPILYFLLACVSFIFVQAFYKHI